MRRSSFAVCITALTVSGCAYGTPTPRFSTSVPRFSSVDVEASEVVLHDDGADLAPEEATTARQELADLFEASTRPRPETPTPARFRAKVTLDSKKGVIYMAFGGCAVAGLVILAPATCGLYFVLGGVGSARTAHVEVALETPQGVVVGEGDGYGSGGLYANARRRALAEALERAMANAASKVAVAK
jgi:hypothetical protein